MTNTVSSLPDTATYQPVRSPGPAQEVAYIDLGQAHRELWPELLPVLERVLTSGQFILGKEVEAFEAEFASLCGTRYAIGVANCTDAIALVLRGLGIGPGDEVITAPNSFLASASAITLAGARPVFVDVRDDYNLDPDQLEGAVTARTRAILPVHLTGRPADMAGILEVARRHGLAVIEDAAQAVGATYQGQRVGSFGAAGCFSLHPLKNLNACGDGGVITTNDDRLYHWLLKARNHGLRDRDACDFWSVNSRLDALQAALLRVKLRHFGDWTARRRDHAAFYARALGSVVAVPQERPGEYSVYHTFIVQADRRDELQQYLATRGIGTRIHYPIPIHLQAAARDLGYRPGDFPTAERQAGRILSLPIHQTLTVPQREYVAAAVRAFYQEPAN
jgi:dTDP-4-amino-4,6-dideoxygalactose transaminase